MCLRIITFVKGILLVGGQVPKGKVLVGIVDLFAADNTEPIAWSDRVYHFFISQSSFVGQGMLAKTFGVECGIVEFEKFIYFISYKSREGDAPLSLPYRFAT
jgi:hypothetical protein